jgi:hypothetical protein
MAMNFLKPIETISARKGSITTIFADFVRLTACCLAPRRDVDGVSLSLREDEYMDVIRRYDKREVELLTQAFGEFILEADKHPHRDILGTSWLEFSSKSSQQARGEFYTPPEICRLMAMISGDAAGFIERGRPFTVQEPACGAGGMILAYAEQFAPDHWHLPRFTAIDINPVACDMTFINTTLWSVPCEVICGNGLFPKETDRRYVNLHWLRVGEEQRRAIQQLFAPRPEPVPVVEIPPVVPPPKSSKDGWIQDDLFAA